jgi:hypothetical protein
MSALGVAGTPVNVCIADLQSQTHNLVESVVLPGAQCLSLPRGNSTHLGSHDASACV